MSTTTSTGMPRRRRPAVVAWLALLLTLSLFAAACGNDSDGGDSADATTTAPAATDTDGDDGGDAEGTDDDGGDAEGTDDDSVTTDDVDPDGVIRIGVGMVFPGGTHLDPTISQVNADRNWIELVLGTLLRWTPDSRIVPWMAESFEIVDSQTFTLTLREGVTFSDGSAYDAEAVKAGMLRTLNAESEATQASLSVAFSAITDITVTDPLNLTITLGEPLAGELAQALTEREGAIVSPAQVAAAPDDIDTAAIGAGPYLVEEFVDAEKATLVKNPDFWDADSWRIGRIEFQNVTESASAANGLLADTIDMFYNTIDVTDGQRLQSDDRFTVVSKPSDRSYVAMLLCTGKPPFDDVNVRKALQVGIDRQTLSDLVFEGLAPPAVGLWPEGHAYYNPALEDVVKYDPDAARELLGSRVWLCGTPCQHAAAAPGKQKGPPRWKCASGASPPELLSDLAGVEGGAGNKPQ